MKHTLLFIDDETDNLDALERVFRKNFHILKANSGPEALKILKSNPKVSVIISDQRMPDMTGVEFLSESIKTHPECVRILLTGFTDLDSVISAINAGQVYRYITKPWDTRDLQMTVNQAIDKFELESELKIKNKELETALLELKTLDEAKSQFMILINHELKTPLTTLVSFLELLKQTTLDEEQDKYTSRIEKSTNRLQEIILDSLELVSSELGQVKLDKIKVDLEKAIDNVEKNLKPQFQNKEYEIEKNIEVTKIQTDPKVLDKVLSRILKNAIQHGNSDKPIVLKITDVDGKTQFQITNAGNEISKETIAKILKPFALNENIMNHSKGLGLGLSICQSLLKSLDSELTIESHKKTITVTFVI